MIGPSQAGQSWLKKGSDPGTQPQALASCPREPPKYKAVTGLDTEGGGSRGRQRAQSGQLGGERHALAPGKTGDCRWTSNKARTQHVHLPGRPPGCHWLCGDKSEDGRQLEAGCTAMNWVNKKSGVVTDLVGWGDRGGADHMRRRTQGRALGEGHGARGTR